ncbi:porin [Cupriavidus sp. NPDC089707]|uniref:porin n=1 Tax=Cupriavidus sp. NPDC089707 TaxID=3363963 RepID=UPI00381BFE3B
MKKATLSPTIALLFSTSAFAQGSVTLYGIIDEGINYTNNVRGDRLTEMQSGFAQGSRWGLKGSEDLGGGVKALFQLENGFNASTGRAAQGGVLFGRQAYVGLADDQLGTITLGRQYDSVIDYLAPTTVVGNWGGYMFGHPYDNDNMVYSFRVNNTVKYTSPSLGGFQFGGTYSFSNDTNFANNRQYGAGMQYASGGLLLAAAYLEADNPSATANGAISSGGDQNFLARRLRIFGAGVNYTFGAATAGFAYSNTNLTQPLSTSYISGSILPAGGTLDALKFQNFEFNFKYQFTPAFYAGAVYTLTTEKFQASSGEARPKVHSIGLMADYNFSKRTDVYLQGVYQRVSGDKTGTALDQAYIPGAADSSSKSSQVLVRAAIRHKF